MNNSAQDISQRRAFAERIIEYCGNLNLPDKFINYTITTRPGIVDLGVSPQTKSKQYPKIQKFTSATDYLHCEKDEFGDPDIIHKTDYATSATDVDSREFYY